MAALGLALTSVGCVPADEVAAQSANQTECVALPATLDRVEDEGQADLTAQRVASLNDYAEAALASRQCELETTLEHREVDVNQTVPLADAYRVVVGNEATCLNGGWLFARRNLNTEGRYDDMKTQVDNVVEFLKQLHEDTHGVPSAIFDTVTICPSEVFGNKMELVGPTLYVNVPFTQFGGISTFDAQDLRADMWTPGKHLEVFENGDKLKALWPLFDPGGTARYALRNGIAQRALGLLARLVGLDGLDVGAMRAELQQLAKENATDISPDENTPSLRARAQAFFVDATPEQLSCVASHWQKDLDDPEAWSQTSEAAVATVYKETARNALNVNVKQDGWVVVGNTHFIHVNLDIFLSGGYERLERYVEIEQVEQNITWEQSGFVVVYTIDDIDVNVSVSAVRSLQSASLDQALNRCGG